MAFDKPTRNRLAAFVAEARRLITDEFTRQFQSLYGIAETGLTPLDQLGHLDDAGLAVAGLLRERIDYLVKTHPEDKDGLKAAVARLAREQAFTVLNRLAAVRMAEKRGLIIESVGSGYQSKGFKVFEQVARSGLGEIYQRYRRYLFCLFDELAVDLGVLFDRRSPQGLLFPGEKALLALLDLLNGPELEPLWQEDETIGWIYQYYNDPAERKKMREESAAPRNSRELAVRNQFFTPRYVVEFLTDNTLGRIWYEMTKGETQLKELCRYLVRRPNEIFLGPEEAAPENPEQEGLSQEELLRQPVYIPHRPLKDPRELCMLDPACGSMHFGLYAFDLYEVIYAEAWDRGMESLRADFPERDALLREIPRLIIEHNIHGIDIDPRAVQIAGLSLWLRAQRSWQEQRLQARQRPRIRRSNIVCAEPMPGDIGMLREFIASQFAPEEEPAFTFLLERVFDRMALAGEAGSLLKIEDEISEAVREAKGLWKKGPQYKPGYLFAEVKPKRPEQLRLDLSGISDEGFWETAEEQIYAALQVYAEQAEFGGYQRRLFAEDAAHGFAFIDLCRKRYEVVLMNPPFGDASKPSRHYIKGAYEHSSADILHAFVEHGIKWLDHNGHVGVISARTGFFLGDSKHWRRNVIFKNRLQCFADLGLGVLDDALVEVAAYTVERCEPTGSQVFTDRQLATRNKDIGLLAAIQASATGAKSGLGIFDQSLVWLIPDQTFAYWAPPPLLRRYSDSTSFRSLVSRVKVGIQTGDDFRFARLGWEVGVDAIGDGMRWRRFSKGGEYSPPFDDIHLLVDWLEDGAQMAAYPSARFQNVKAMFTPGATYTVRTASAFAGKVLPAGCVFSHNAQSWFAQPLERVLLSIGYLSCRVPQTFVELAVGSGDIATAGSAARRYTTAVVEGVPTGPIELLDAKVHVPIVKSLYRYRVTEIAKDESSCLFTKFAIPMSSMTFKEALHADWSDCFDRATAALTQSAELDSAVTRAFGLSKDEERFIENEVGLHPSCYKGTAEESNEIRRLFHLGDEDLINEAIAKKGSKRWFTKKSYFVDRRIEILCHVCRISPATVRDVICNGEITIGLIGLVVASISQALGVVFGRWDIRYATGELQPPELPAPFAPLPACPPGMLQGDDGLPFTPEAGRQLRAAGHYPLDIAWNGILVDDPGHPFDIEHRLSEVFTILWQDRVETIEQEACEILGVKSLRDYFRKPSGFFADHLKRYSKSRRQAPIYWPLSTAKGSYTLWIYYHRLNDQTLHTALADFVEPKIKDVRAEISLLRESNNNRSRLEELLDLEWELLDFRAEIERIIRLPWQPNLNDGVLITAAPLWRLFRLPKWQKDLKACWDKLEKGEYDWAHLAYSIWPKRVEEVCKKDRSIAIAHGLEHLCQVEPPKPKAKRGRKKAE